MRPSALLLAVLLFSTSWTKASDSHVWLDVPFVKDYDAAGLRRSIPLYGTGFLTDGVLEAQGAAAEGLLTTLHYVEDLDNAANKKLKESFKAATKRDADVYAVQGYDTGLLLSQALDDVPRRGALPRAGQAGDPEHAARGGDAHCWSRSQVRLS